MIANITCRKAGLLARTTSKSTWCNRQHKEHRHSHCAAIHTDDASTSARAESIGTSNSRSVHCQQTAITRNIVTSVEVRDRSELKGIPFSGQKGAWDS